MLLSRLWWGAARADDDKERAQMPDGNVSDCDEWVKVDADGEIVKDAPWQYVPNDTVEQWPSLPTTWDFGLEFNGSKKAPTSRSRTRPSEPP